MQAVYLAAAILLEVGGTICLRVAADGRRVWYVPVTVGYVLSFVFLSLALRAGLGIGIAYGIWAAIGVVLTATASKLLFGEPLTWLMSCGMALIIGGVLLVELGAH